MVDYRDLPAAVWQRVAPFLGLVPNAEDITRMKEDARYYAKDPVKRVFAADAGAIPEAIRDLARSLVDPIYRRLLEPRG